MSDAAVRAGVAVRFCDETAPYGIMDGLIGERDNWACAVLDHAVLASATTAGVARYKQKIPGSTKKQSPHWNTDVVEAMVEAGKIAGGTAWAR